MDAVIDRKEIHVRYGSAPQALTHHGRYVFQSSKPYLSHDIWSELVDQRETFFVRPYEDNYPESEKRWKRWLNKQRHPITLIMNNNLDWPWPHYLNSFTEEILEHKNIRYLYVSNPIITHEKVRPLPIGLKYQFHSRRIYGETKNDKNEIFQNVSSSPRETEILFHDNNRTNTIWVRPMKNTDYRKQYPSFNTAMSISRARVCDFLKLYASDSTICTQDMMNQTEYFEELKTHTFVASPTGHGLDSHSTWEALLAGCIPIVPHSSLDPMFENLPVWLIDHWNEVTDEEMENKIVFFKKTPWHWEKIFVEGWAHEIFNGRDENIYKDATWLDM